MRILRSKAARKTLTFYKVAFDVRPPYKVLLDGNFLHHALSKVKTTVVARLKRLFGKADVRLFVPRAVIAELETLGDPCAEALEFCRGHCTLIGDAKMTPKEAILSLVAGEETYVVATQDPDLQRDLRKLPGVLLASFSGTVLALDPPSKASLRAAARNERQKERPDDNEAQLARSLRRKKDDGVVAPAPQRRLKKRAAGPNPLSCLKSTKKAPASSEPDPEKKRRRRRKVASS